jgi:hypothetical protein
MSTSFQIVGDSHYFLDSTQPFDPSTLPPKPGVDYLIVTGDIAQAYTKQAVAFYTHCAQNWKKTFIVLGNQEYEAAGYMFPISMEYHEAYMRHLINQLNAVYGERLQLIQRDFVDLPELQLRIAGLTLWPDGTALRMLRKTVAYPNTTYSFTMEGPNCILQLNQNLRFTRPTIRQTDEFVFNEYGHPPGVRNPFDGDTTVSALQLEPSDLQALQAEDSAFIERMVTECQQSGYRLLMVSHYIPTLDVIPESPVVHNYIDRFPFHEHCRDMSRYLTSPICAWVCGHIHHEQISGIVHINCSEVTV